MKRVLFVDDDPNVLDGLRRMLRPMRDEWDMAFVGSGAAALDLLSSESYDVIVTDMRMPGMNGVELMQQVAQSHPMAIRIALSGQAEMEAIVESIRVLHQYLSQPCDADTLKQAVDRACSLRDFLACEELKAVINRCEALPSLPSLYVELMDELRSPEASLSKVGAIISKDLGMTSKLLQLVNSAFFGLNYHVSSPAHAAALLGLDIIKALALATKVFSQFDPASLPIDIEASFQRCAQTAVLGKQIVLAESKDTKTADIAFMAGMLHDIGELVLASQFAGPYARALSLAREETLQTWQAEHQVLNCTHMEVGAYLLGLWGLPTLIVESAAFHHYPARSVCAAFSPLTAVHVANAILERRDPNMSGHGSAAFDLDYLNRLDLIERIPAWEKLAQEVMQRTEPGS